MAAKTREEGDRLLGLVGQGRADLPAAVDRDIDAMSREIIQVAEDVGRACVDLDPISVHRMALPTFAHAMDAKMSARYGSELTIGPHWQLAP